MDPVVDFWKVKEVKGNERSHTLHTTGVHTCTWVHKIWPSELYYSQDPVEGRPFVMRSPQMVLSSPIPHIILPPCSVTTTHEQEMLQDVVLSPYITGDDEFKVKRRSDCFWVTEAHCRHTAPSARVPA